MISDPSLPQSLADVHARKDLSAAPGVSLIPRSSMFYAIRNSTGGSAGTPRLSRPPGPSEEP